MAMELLHYRSSLERDRDAHEAASAGLESMQTLIHLLSHHHTFPLHQQQQASQACSSVADATISQFKKVCSLLTRSGHAQFRRRPASRQATLLGPISEATLMEAPASSSSISELDSNKGSYSSSPEPSSSICAPPMPIMAAAIQQEAYQMNAAIPKAITVRNDAWCMIPKNSVYNRTTPLSVTPARNTSLYRPSAVLPQQQVQANNNIVAISNERASQGRVPMETSYGKNTNTYPLRAYPPQQVFFQGPAILNPNEKATHMEMSYGKSATTYSLSEHSLSCTPPPSTTTGSFMSSLSIDGSVSKDKNSAFQQVFGGSGGRPPLSVSKKKCSGGEPGGKCHSSGKCHCSKRRKLRNRTIVRVPAISGKMADIPPDEFLWRKYGQKNIKGSPHPRGYYRCSSMRGGCLATKHVERALDDPNMLIVTYKGEHSHGQMLGDNTGEMASTQG